MRVDIFQYDQESGPDLIPISEDDTSLEKGIQEYKDAGWEEEPDFLLKSVTVFVTERRIVATITYVPVLGRLLPDMIVQELFADGSILIRQYRRVDRDDGPYTVVQVGNPVPY